MSETTIDLPESLTIHHIESQFGDLKIAFQSDVSTIKINGANLDTIDTSGLQAILVLIKDAMADDKIVLWEGVSETLKVSAEKIGLIEKLQIS
ncbi:STAS domain-containing protein [Thiosulfativibrio zosterae]|uniref:STAS domain-containing protein n=1 Tax=Thiosulfativibrio zosterae TaxID=2675053 RepID=A0A6F8PMS6_9GAMM|nr:STAS domain-containing protein [Thiosulfativibrio zosterae]BBP43300.1 hypothetical protein THMIRHAT_10460 [Thiosulfativibrio zosterae]